MPDLKTTAEERAAARVRLALKRENGLLSRALDDLDTLTAQCADYRSQIAAMDVVLAGLRSLGESEKQRTDTLAAEVERMRAALQEINDARVTEHGLELSRDLLSRIWAMTNEEPTK